MGDLVKSRSAEPRLVVMGFGSPKSSSPSPAPSRMHDDYSRHRGTRLAWLSSGTGRLPVREQDDADHLPDEVVTGVLVNAIAVAGRQISKAVAGVRKSDDVAAARWFETSRVTGTLLTSLRQPIGAACKPGGEPVLDDHPPQAVESAVGQQARQDGEK